MRGLGDPPQVHAQIWQTETKTEIKFSFTVELFRPEAHLTPFWRKSSSKCGSVQQKRMRYSCCFISHLYANWRKVNPRHHTVPGVATFLALPSGNYSESIREPCCFTQDLLLRRHMKEKTRRACRPLKWVKCQWGLEDFVSTSYLI